MTEEDADSNPIPPPLPGSQNLPPPPPLSSDLPPPPAMPLPPPTPDAAPVPTPEMMPPPPPMPGMPAPPPMPELTAPPPPMPEMPAPPPMPEMPAPPPMPDEPAPPPMPEMPAPPPMPDEPAPTSISEPSTSSTELSTDDVVDDSAVDLVAAMAAFGDDSSEADSDSNDSVPVDLDTLSTDLMDESESVVEVESISDYKWKDTVLDKILSKYDISDREGFLNHAMAYDSNGNHYLTKSEFAEAGIAWVAMQAEENADEQVEVDEEEEIVADEPLVVPEPNPEPLPSPEPELTSIDLPPPPLPTDSAPPPVPITSESIPLQELESTPIADESVDIQAEEMAETDNYADLWKRRSDKSLPQMYGAIDRIGSGEIGSLLERYSDRFGHELDREIIVMRRAEQDALREATPTVELISAPDSEDDEEVEDDEFKSRLTEVEDILRPLQKAYKSTDEKSEKKRLAPALKALIAERKALISVIGGEDDESILDDLPERPEIPVLSTELEDEEEEEDEPVVAAEADHFVDFCGMIDALLGKMPEDWIGDFMDSKGFKLYQKVASDPDGANDKLRAKYFKMIDGELVNMPSDMLDEFMASEEFDLYRIVGEKYGG